MGQTQNKKLYLNKNTKIRVYAELHHDDWNEVLLKNNEPYGRYLIK